VSTRVDTLTTHDIGEAANVIATAFGPLAIAHWLVPDDRAERLRCLREQFALQLRNVLVSGHGTVQGVRSGSQLVAVAVWRVQPGSEPPPPSAGYNATLRRITGPHYDRFRLLDDLFAQHTPRRPHHHLELLAAGRQNIGLGSLLLEHYTNQADHVSGEPRSCHLHASSADAARLYRRHGFADDEPVEIPGSEVRIYPMTREPRRGVPR